MKDYTKQNIHPVKFAHEMARDESSIRISQGKQGRHHNRGNTTAISISVVALIAVFAFLYFFTGVFGETRIGITLRTNPDLENGLVAHYTFDGEVEVGTYEFGVGGATTTDYYDNDDSPKAVLVDGPYLITVGKVGGSFDPCVIGSSCVHYEKRDKVTSEFVATFGVGGSTTTDHTSSIDQLEDLVVDETYIYSIGWQAGSCPNGGSACWLYEKRNKTTGEFESTFGSFGATTSDPSSGADYGYDIEIDGNYLYASGQENNCSVGLTCWRIEKRSKISGELITSFGVNGATTSDPSSSNDSATDIQIDGDYIYLSGSQGAGCSNGSRCWRYEKRYKSTGALVSPFGVNGATTSDPSANSDDLQVLKIDGDYIYGAGSQDDCTTTDTCWRIEKRDKTTGELVPAFGVGGATTSNPSSNNDSARDMVIAGDYLYLGGYQDDCEGGTDWCWRYEKRDKTTGELVTAFGVGGATTSNPTTAYNEVINSLFVDDGFIYAAGTNEDCGGTPGRSCYQYEKRDAETGELASTTSSDAVTLIGGASEVPGNIGQGLEFDGIDDYVDAGDLNASSSAFAFWMYTDYDVTNSLPCTTVLRYKEDVFVSTEQNLIVIGDGCTSYMVSETIGIMSEYVLDDYDRTYIRDVLEAGWNHMVFNWNGSSYDIYLNGAQRTTYASSDSGGAGHVRVPVDVSMLKMAAGSGSSESFEGKIDDLRIYDRALSVSEISRLYDLGATTKINKTLNTNPELQENSVLYYSFDGENMDLASNTAEVIDGSGNDFRGNWLNHGTTTTIGVVGQGLEFDGLDDRINVTPTGFSALSDYTIAFWVKTFVNPLDTWQGVFTIDSYDPVWGFESNALTIYDLGEGNINCGGALGYGKWKHVVFRRLGTNVATYVDGELFGSCSHTSTPLDVPASLIVGYSGDQQEYLNGNLDDLRVYDTALSTSTIKRLYELGATTKVAKTIDTNPDLQNGLVGHWTFDGPDVDLNTPGDEIIDRSSSGEAANWIDHATTTTYGRIGQAIDFDGVDDYIQISGGAAFNENLDTFTYSAWIKPKGWGGNSEGFILGQGLSSTRKYLRLHNSGAPLGSVRGFINTSGTDASAYTSANTISLNEWYHVVMTYDEAGDRTVRIYIDGSESAYDSSVSGNAAMADDSNDQLWIADDPASSGEYFSGLIDDVRIYDRVLSASEILRLYHLGQ